MKKRVSVNTCVICVIVMIYIVIDYSPWDFKITSVVFIYR